MQQQRILRVFFKDGTYRSYVLIACVTQRPSQRFCIARTLT
jgi:hypothetical protein